ncbi:hypothetical protein BGX34_002562 [Mortierella sp. NVP85]|nr:hypothetical protein BGX34_002562 [Mortierella sp. NVP85]
MRAPTEALTVVLAVSDDMGFDYDKLSEEVWDLVEKKGGKVHHHLDVDDGTEVKLIVSITPDAEDQLRQRKDLRLTEERGWWRCDCGH